LFAVLAERLFFNHQPTKAQKLGFTFIAMAALLVLFNAMKGGSGVSSHSIGFMLLAAAGWSAYVVAFRHTGLTAAEGAAWVCTASTIIIVMAKLITGGVLLPLTIEQLVFHAFAQGFLSGFVAVILYTTAIERIGPARAASFSVLMPVLGVMFAWIWLGETPSGSNMIALLLGTAGVAVVNGPVGKTR
jgi:drug/metabolite transporter (DMT)-like permease